MRRYYRIVTVISGPSDVIAVPTAWSRIFSRIPPRAAALARPSFFDTWQPTTRTHLLHAGLAVFLVLVSVVDTAASGTATSLGLTIFNALCLPLASCLPLVGAVTSLAVTTAALAVPDSVGLTATSAYWGPLVLLASRGYHPGAVWSLATTSLLSSIFLGGLTSLDALTAFVIVGAPCMTLGLTLRHQRQKSDEAARQRRERRGLRQRLLVSELHDTVVRNLTHAVMQAEQAKIARPEDLELTRTLDSVIGPVRSATGQLRYLLRAMSSASGNEALLLLSTTPPRPLEETLAQAEQILTQRDTTLEVTGLEALDTAAIGPGMRQQITRVLAELIENAVKYASVHGRVTLLLETDGGTLECMCTNTRDPTRHQPPRRQAGHRHRAEAEQETQQQQVVSSGLGLDTARRRIESLGGALTTTHTPRRWTTAFSIPLTPAI
ncbi:histidine kinase [Actinomyces lilanjuaniae]|uniref:Histidine kinase n=1 Tax=Actinomyces lilanjuaniae TaxID=2321394 RepID=A0ABM6Z250_9ACTO|nr:ATP-binding protein [Actinomyces lilanjuaniae]AYD89223.1 histidine kinase [Actinomyces lilanjuaniae]